jgi:DNA-binding response OmpR family regulator
MSDVKKLLVVDDRYEMLDFLQSMLELTSEDYEVVAVPSAEEALLELRHANLDLLITDARLPGMSGFDLVRRMRRTRLNKDRLRQKTSASTVILKSHWTRMKC